MDKNSITAIIKVILEKQGKSAPDLGNDVTLRALNFRSLDFSELCLRVEQEVGRELNFEANTLRQITTIKDVCDFISSALKN